jgi:UDP-4-amino-4,6-dideoxy-N-acetyl-beta-L-altrosamine N-acetyltransferase
LKNFQLINFTELSLKDKELILNWRNNDSIRKWMYNNNLISKEEHFDFLKQLSNCDDKLYFLVKEDDKNIGVIDFVNIKNQTAEMGIYSSPFLKGYGEILLDLIIDYATKKLKLKKIKAEVFAINKRAVNLYERKGFIKIGSKVFRDNEMIIMELNFENRKI